MMMLKGMACVRVYDDDDDDDDGMRVKVPDAEADDGIVMWVQAMMAMV